MKKEKSINVLFLVPSPLGISPGQRFRFEHFLPMLKLKKINYKVSPFLSFRGRQSLYSNGNFLNKVIAIAGGYRRRIVDLFTLHRYEYIYIHRWATTAGPPIFEWIIAKIFRKKIIYDFDDAIWVKESAYNKKFLAVKFLGKVAKICKWADTVTVGNKFLKAFADKYSQNVIILPTVVNTTEVHSTLQNQYTQQPSIGWTGSFSTLIYLDIIIPVLQKLQNEIDFTFIVIADKNPALPLKNYKFICWDKDTEVQDLLKFHIGLMPLTDDEITKGKCGFKAIQYMALGIPAVVSNVGVNVEIINNGVDGFICKDLNEWENTLRQLLQDSSLRHKISLTARKKIEEKYSVAATAKIFFNIFHKMTVLFFLLRDSNF